MILSSTESNHNFFSYVSEKRKEYSFQNDIFSTIFALLNKSRERQQPGKCIGSNTEYIYHSGIFNENRSDKIRKNLPLDLPFTKGQTISKAN